MFGATVSGRSAPLPGDRVDARAVHQPLPVHTLAREALADDGGAGPATVLLSPAAASFDMFEDYAARGRAFKAAVAGLAAERRAGGPR